jgi:hypothetical protein
MGFLLDSFDVVSSVVSLSWAPPVLTATPAGAAVVCEPVDVEVIDDSGVEDASDVFAGVDELVEGFWLTDSVEVVSEFDEVDGSAHAIPGLVNTSAPNPSVRARLPIRPAYASQRTRQLYRQRRRDMPSTANIAQVGSGGGKRPWVEAVDLHWG